MIETYTAYIDRFLLSDGLDGARPPGEHHFVASYLVPALFRINRLVPDYINPDGTKGIIGDVVYFNSGEHHFGIEVKLGTIRLTKNEFNSWIVNDDISSHPDVFIGIGTAGAILLSWCEFRNAYLKSVDIKSPAEIENGYGPQKSINVFFNAGHGKGYFPRGVSKLDAQTKEAMFLRLLREVVNR